MENPHVWAVIWLAAAATFGIGEIVAAGSFFLAPFALGALLASIVSLFGAPVIASWAVFLIASVAAFFMIRPLAKRLDVELPQIPGIGANRLVGIGGVVVETIPVGLANTGMVKVGGEQWRAEGRDGMGVAPGTPITIIEVKGTRVIVEPTLSAPGTPDPTAPPVG